MTKVVTEFSFQVDDYPGALASLADLFGKAGVNIDGGVGLALGGKALIKFVIYKAEAAVKALKHAGINYDTRELIEIKVKDKPGELAKISKAVSEAGVKAIIRACWNAGGNPSDIMVGPFNKTKVSGFSGILTNNIFQKAGGQATIIAAADAYVSDFGNHQVTPNRFNRDRTLNVLDFEYWSIAYLRPFTQFPLAKTGDSTQRQILAEYCLVSKNQAASGKVADLTTS